MPVTLPDISFAPIRRQRLAALAAAAVGVVALLGGCGTVVSVSMLDLAPPPMAYATTESQSAHAAATAPTPASVPVPGRR